MSSELLSFELLISKRFGGKFFVKKLKLFGMRIFFESPQTSVCMMKAQYLAKSNYKNEMKT